MTRRNRIRSSVAGDWNEDHALRAIAAGTAADSGTEFFHSLVRQLAEVLNVRHAWITEFSADYQRLKALAFWTDIGFRDDVEYDLAGTPCAAVVRDAEFVHHTEGVQQLYPDDSVLGELEAESYLGVPLVDADGTVLGHLAVIGDRPMPAEPQGLAIFRIFANRAAAELRLMRTIKALHDSTQRLDRILDGAMDAIVTLDEECSVVLFNAAAEETFKCKAADAVGQDFRNFLAPESCTSFDKRIDALRSDSEHSNGYLWLPAGVLHGCRNGGGHFPIEATVSNVEVDGNYLCTFILRDVDERIRAEQEIAKLTRHTRYLREEIQTTNNFKEIIGERTGLKSVLRKVEQVAALDTTVLILGETGTGKELIARALHGISRKRDHPLIKVNCAALPESLIESELFGHEKGAFTGATKQHIGRFELAAGSTIFLDEIGDLPFELQAKLLRVLQDGEFERLGGGRTLTTDARVVAATNRDLKRAVENGTFREDLYYRLSVFPITIPALRDRRADIPLLVEAFANRFAKKIGRVLRQIPPETMTAFCEHAWPGNVRELQNVVERALILAEDGVIRADPQLRASQLVANQLSQSAGTMKEVEKSHILQTLEGLNWVIGGDEGAAECLGLKPSTLRSRMKKLGIAKPG